METSKSKKLLNSDPTKKEEVLKSLDTARSSVARRQSMLSDKQGGPPSAISTGMPKSSLRRQTRRKPTEEPLSESISSHKMDDALEASPSPRGAFGGQNANSGVQTPGERGGQNGADDDSPSLWLRKTPEEIFEYYKQLGPEWRNEYEKTDLTYSTSSPWYNKEVIPGSGIPVIPNMSREPVGMYARSLRNRKKTALDLNTYAVELSGRPASYYLNQQDQDRRSTLSYGLSHSPSTPLARPYHAYPNGKHIGAAGSTSSSSSSFVSRSRALVSQSVTMVTKLFIVLYSAVTYVWRHRERGAAQEEGVDTVDAAIGYGGAARQNYYEYKTGVKRSSRSSQAAGSSSSTSSSWSSWSQSIYQLTTWLVETNTRLFWYKDRSVESVSGQRTRRYVQYGALAVLLLLLGFWLFCPLYSDSASSSSSSGTDLNSQSSPLSSTTSRILSLPSDLLYYATIPISSSVNFVTSHLRVLPSATSQFLVDLCTRVADFGSAIRTNLVHYISLPGKSVFAGVSYVWESIFSGMTSMCEFVFSGLKSGLSSTNEFVASIPTAFIYCVRSLVYWVTMPVLYCRDLVWSLATLSGAALTPAVQTKVPAPAVVPVHYVHEKDNDVQQRQEQKVVYPSVEDIVLRVLGDVRFQSMIEGSVRQSVDTKEKQREQTEKALQEKVKELCTKLVESELVKLKAAVEKVDQDIKRRQEENVQTTIPAVSGPSHEEWTKHSAQVEDMILELKALQSEHQRISGGDVDPMAQYSALIDDKIRAAFAMYDADKTGLTDYALESAGGSVIDIRCTETYTLRDPYYVLFGLTLWRRDSSPRKAIQPGLLPGECWAFQGAVGCLVLKLSHRIHVTRFSMEHIPKALTPRGEIDSAPKKFAVWGLTSKYDERPTLLGEFMYDRDGPTLQFFEAKEVSDGFDMVELKIQSNHGNIEYTCLYRFRVHGNIAPAPSSSYDSSPLRGGTPGGARNQNEYQSEQLHQSHHNAAATTSYDPKYNPV
uniref:SUN domain-containing protein 1 n=1 Tax=Cacopsylla melanoneura TaxID=428564 RepID=A0A8D8V4F2_9HEMI